MLDNTSRPWHWQWHWMLWTEVFFSNTQNPHETLAHCMFYSYFVATRLFPTRFRGLIWFTWYLWGISSPKKLSWLYLGLGCSLSKVIYYSEILSQFCSYFSKLFRKSELTYLFCADLLLHILTMLCFLFF